MPDPRLPAADARLGNGINAAAMVGGAWRNHRQVFGAKTILSQTGYGHACRGTRTYVHVHSSRIKQIHEHHDTSYHVCEVL